MFVVSLFFDTLPDDATQLFGSGVANEIGIADAKLVAKAADKKELTVDASPLRALLLRRVGDG